MRRLRCTAMYAIRASATRTRPRRAIGQPKLIAASPRSAGSRRACGASRRRWRGSGAERRASAARGRVRRGRPPPLRRTARRSFRLRVSTRSCRPDSGSTSQRSPTSGSSCSRGSWISTATTSWRAARWSSRGRQSRGPRKSDTTTITERRRARRPIRARAAPSEVGPMGSRSGSRRSACRSASRPRLPWRAGEATGLRSPNVASASRLPRRTAKCPTASETPSATSHFRRSAVPNVIDADVSSRSHVSTARSATLTRTCGSPVRAVTFQSIMRTSSPGAYGRTCASSVPSPVAHERWSPASSPSIRRRTVRLTLRRSAAGSGPGPGRPGVRAGRSAWTVLMRLPAGTRSSCGIAIVSSTRSRIGPRRRPRRAPRS